MDFGNENVRVRMEDDRISSLPDEIIHRIMSFNDTKYAVQTSVLSSRWKLIWTTLPYLKLSTLAFHHLCKFSKFVDLVISHRNNGTQVSSLHLTFRGSAKQRFVQKLGKYVVAHNVQEVNIFALNLMYEEEHRFPLCFFNSKSLKHLGVETNFQRLNPLLQSPWDSPALTTVVLNDIWLCNDNTILDLFSKCVNLMNLTLRECRSKKGCMVMKIQCPRLVHLSISNCRICDYEILAPNLSSFYYQGWYAPNLAYTGGLSSLEKVNLHINKTGSTLNNEDILYAAFEYVNTFYELCNARFVTLNGHAIEFLSNSKVLDFVEQRPSPFCNLKCLSIVGVDTQQNHTKSGLTSQVINYLLSSSPTATVSMHGTS